MVLPENKSSRNLLPYFLESKLWLSFSKAHVFNFGYWAKEDVKRLRRMMTGRSAIPKRLGITVEEYIYDMIDCVYSSHLKEHTKQRLFDELDLLEAYHIENKTNKAEIRDD